MDTVKKDIEFPNLQIPIGKTIKYGNTFPINNVDKLRKQIQTNRYSNEYRIARSTLYVTGFDKIENDKEGGTYLIVPFFYNPLFVERKIPLAQRVFDDYRKTYFDFVYNEKLEAEIKKKGNIPSLREKRLLEFKPKFRDEDRHNYQVSYYVLYKKIVRSVMSFCKETWTLKRLLDYDANYGEPFLECYWCLEDDKNGADIIVYTKSNKCYAIRMSADTFTAKKFSNIKESIRCRYNTEQFTTINLHIGSYNSINGFNKAVEVIGDTYAPSEKVISGIFKYMLYGIQGDIRVDEMSVNTFNIEPWVDETKNGCEQK